MKKITLDGPDLKLIKKTISSLPDEIVMTLESKQDNGNELVAIALIVDAGYILDLKPIDEKRKKFIATFTKKT